MIKTVWGIEVERKKNEEIFSLLLEKSSTLAHAIHLIEIVGEWSSFEYENLKELCMKLFRFLIANSFYDALVVCVVLLFELDLEVADG